jgi:hypothetical protein
MSAGTGFEEGPVNHGRRSERLIALGFLGFLLFNYPLLSLFSTEGTVLGIPVLYA